MPAGGGQQKTIAQTVKIEIKKRIKYVINPFSSIIFNPPPIDEVRLQLTEATSHMYAVGYGEGDGAGFAGGTKRGKVRFIRIEYTGGDWNQDFGVGSDLNMLNEYGIRTKQKINSETESAVHVSHRSGEHFGFRFGTEDSPRIPARQARDDLLR
jgi:hypothetical protein